MLRCVHIENISCYYNNLKKNKEKAKCILKYRIHNESILMYLVMKILLVYKTERGNMKWFHKIFKNYFELSYFSFTTKDQYPTSLHTDHRISVVKYISADKFYTTLVHSIVRY